MPTGVRPMKAGEPAGCEQILRSLPDWFGIESSIVSYVRDLHVMETWIAEYARELVGFLALRVHNEHAAEIHVMAVSERVHGLGCGRRLVEHAQAVLKARSVEFLQVKTLGPSKQNDAYERTRGSQSVGFLPLEETSLWGDENPCLVR